MSSYFKFLFSIDDLVVTFKGVLEECHVIYHWAEVNDQRWQILLLR